MVLSHRFSILALIFQVYRTALKTSNTAAIDSRVYGLEKPSIAGFGNESFWLVTVNDEDQQIVAILLHRFADARVLNNA